MAKRYRQERLVGPQYANWHLARPGTPRPLQDPRLTGQSWRQQAVARGQDSFPLRAALKGLAAAAQALVHLVHTARLRTVQCPTKACPIHGALSEGFKHG